MKRKAVKCVDGLDELFASIGTFRKSKDAQEMFEFVARFPKLAPYNAMLVHMQKPGCQMVATARVWRQKYGRVIKFNARPLVILWPFGPVNFVFDISDTEALEDAVQIPPEALNPLQASGKLPRGVWKCVTENLCQLGIALVLTDLGSHVGGCIARFAKPYYQEVDKKLLKVLYGVKLNQNHDLLTQFATLTHELGHLFCGHLGGEKYYPDRKDLLLKDREEQKKIREFEAESVSWLVCKRMGVHAPAAQYLDHYLADSKELPEVSLEAIFLAVGRIESMCRLKLGKHKDIALDNSEEARLYRPWSRREKWENLPVMD